MITAVALDGEAIARACERHGVARLRVFGSVLTERFDPSSSDVDLLVDFLAGREDAFADYVDLKADLEQIIGHRVDLVVARSVKNPYFEASAFNSARDVYAALVGGAPLGRR